MKKTNRNNLLDSLAQFGYPLLEPQGIMDPNEILSALVQSTDSRVLEGFPVVLANCAAREDSGLDLDKAAALVTKPRCRELFWQVVSLSNALFDLYGLDDLRTKRVRKVWDGDILISP